jgi:hypothetical protein
MAGAAVALGLLAFYLGVLGDEALEVVQPARQLALALLPGISSQLWLAVGELRPAARMVRRPAGRPPAPEC